MTDPNTHKPSRYFDPESDPLPYPEEAVPENRVENTSVAAGNGPPSEKQEEGPSPLLDLNNNGIPDYKEPWLWRCVWTVFSFVVRVLAPSHTLIHRGVSAVEQARNTLPPL